MKETSLEGLSETDPPDRRKEGTGNVTEHCNRDAVNLRTNGGKTRQLTYRSWLTAMI